MQEKHSLKTQILFLTLILVAVLLAGSFFSFRNQTRALRSLETSFKEDLGIVVQIPLLADVIREIDLSTEEFLLTKNQNLLDERSVGIRLLDHLTTSLEPLSQDPRLVNSWKVFKTKLRSYLEMQAEWIRQRQQGELSAANTMQIILAQSPANELEEMANHIKDVKVFQLDAQRKNTQQQSLYTVFFLFLTLLISCAILALMLRIYVLMPLTKLNKNIQGWKAGSDWFAEESPPNLEFERIHHQMQRMAGRINDQFQQELELRKIKSHLVSWISHELVNALSVIGGAAEQLEDSDAAPFSPERQNLYKMIQTRIQSVLLTSENLLNLGKAESGKLVIRASRVEIPALISQCVDALRFVSEKKKIEIRVEGIDGPSPVMADASAIRLVLLNLINNSLKYTPHGGSVRVGYGLDPADEKKVRIFVEDTGVGISPADQKNILSDFFRAEESKSMADGYGVGLFLVKAILDAHGSELMIFSELKKGSCFSFSLPCLREV
jgi:signal transduction histidine kinase